MFTSKLYNYYLDLHRINPKDQIFIVAYKSADGSEGHKYVQMQLLADRYSLSGMSENWKLSRTSV